MSELNYLYLDAHFTEKDFTQALNKTGGANSSAVLKDPKLYKATFDFFKAISQEKLEMVSAGPAATSAVASGINAVLKVADVSKNTKNMSQVASTSASVFKTSMELTKAVRLTSFGGVLMLIGSTSLAKGGIITSFAGIANDSDNAKCAGAVMELAGTVATGALLSGATLGAGSPLVALSLIASAVNTGLQCAPVMKKSF